MVAFQGWADVPIRPEEEIMSRSFFQKVKHRLVRMRLHPISVFLFHQVSDVFQPETMWDIDWTQTETFKRNILALKKKYTFIPLDEVTERLSCDRFRFRDYAALTSDDGWASLKTILPWLVEQEIPVTLFLNPSCLDGLHKNSRETDKLLTKEDVLRIVEEGKPYISVASHGWTHKDSTKMTMDEFQESVQESEEVLTGIPGKVPYFAFASGKHTPKQVGFLKSEGLIPVFVDGAANEKDPTVIHRYCIDGRRFNG